MRTRIFRPKTGQQFAFHVFTPALLERTTNKVEYPVMALRFSEENYQNMILLDQIDCLGESQLLPLFDNPLPGTGGRGVAIMFTKSPILCHYKQKLKKFDCNDSRTPKDILDDVVNFYKDLL